MAIWPLVDHRVFWSNVNPDGRMPDTINTPCWLWQGNLDGDGYGHFKHQKAHRFAWAITYGTPSDDLVVCHWCDVPNCVRPDHLWLGTKQLNMLDAMKKGRRRNSVLKRARR